MIATPTLAAECIPSRVAGPNPMDKVGEEYGKTVSSLKDHQVILTFDDGPSPGNTQRVLEILKNNCISAVFFVIGEKAQRHQELVRMMANYGHIVGSHSWSHPQPFNRFSNVVTASEIDNGASIVHQLVPNNDRSFFRYPGFGHNSFTEHYTERQGLTVWGANIDPKDWKEPGTETLVQRILSQLSKLHRGIIVLHENHTTTVAALPSIIKSLRENGYEIVGIF